MSIFELAQYGKIWQLIEVTEPIKVPIICDNCNILNDAGSASCLGAVLVRFVNKLLFTADFGSFCAAKTDKPGQLNGGCNNTV